MTTSRRWCAAGAAGVALFATYVSLVPFDFVAPANGASLSELLRSAETRIVSPTNLLANAILFAPLGLFGVAALVERESSVARRLAAAVAVLAAATALSITIEAAQLFVPRRTPSLADVCAHAVGTAAGISIWGAVGHRVIRAVLRWLPANRQALVLALVGYAAARLFLLWQPLDVSVAPAAIAGKVRSGGVVVNPLASPLLSWASLPILLAQAVISAPLGVLGVAGLVTGDGRRAPSALIVSGALFFAGAETARLFVRSANVDALECTANWLGFVCGVVIAVALEQHSAKRSEVTRAPRTLIGAALVFTALTYAAYNLSPYDFSSSQRFIGGRLTLLTRVPFAGYYQNPEFKALADVLFKVCLALPFGALFQYLARLDRKSVGRLLEVGWLAATGLFFIAVEIGQVLLPSRYPDNTDVLLAVCGVWLGIRLARRHG